MRTVHNYFGYVVAAANLAVGAWGIVRWRRQRAGSRAFWTALGIAWATIYVQGLMGLAMFERYKPPFRHHFYGFLFAIITLAVLPLRSEDDRTRLVVFSFASLFIGIVAIRAIFSL
jgi:hypothetical protein